MAKYDPFGVHDTYLLCGVFITRDCEVRWWATSNQSLLKEYSLMGVHNFHCSSNMQFVYKHNSLTDKQAYAALCAYPMYKNQEY